MHINHDPFISKSIYLKRILLIANREEHFEEAFRDLDLILLTLKLAICMAVDHKIVYPISILTLFNINKRKNELTQINHNLFGH